MNRRRRAELKAAARDRRRAPKQASKQTSKETSNRASEQRFNQTRPPKGAARSSGLDSILDRPKRLPDALEELGQSLARDRADRKKWQVSGREDPADLRQLLARVGLVDLVEDHNLRPAASASS